MLKILYAAGNSINAKIALSRFLEAIKGKPYIIKIAAYKASSPINQEIDWTLDSLLNIFRPSLFSLEDNDNFDIYLSQIRYFLPDLIISDMEYFTSQIANMLDITLWQCSSLLINYAMPTDDKYNLGLNKQYSFILNKESIFTQRIVNLIDNSNSNFVYSHFGDTENPPTLKSNFEWIRPYHKVGKKYTPCIHNIVSVSLDNNKNILTMLKQYDDTVVFMKDCNEHYNNVSVKNIDLQDEYFCNLKNCSLFVCEGQTNFLADSFYNGKYSVSVLNFKEPESIINGIISQHLNIGVPAYQTDINLYNYISKPVSASYNKDIKYLHQKIEDI